MADKKYGIVLTAKDEASKAVKTLSGAMGASTKAVKKLGSMGATAFKSLGASIVVANQALELGKKAFSAISGVVNSTIDAFKELRGQSNPLVRQLDKIRTRSLALKASLGTAFTAAILAVHKAYKPLLGSSLKFLENNRKLIATKIVQFVFKLAQGINEGIASAISAANDLWATWNLTVDKAVVSITNWLGAWSESMKVMSVGEEAMAKYNARLDKLSEANYKAQQRIDGHKAAHGKFADEIERVKRAIQKLIDQGYKPAVAAAKVLADAAGATPLETAEQALNRLRDQAFGLIPALDKVSRALGEGLSAEQGIIAFEKFERRFDRVNRMLGIAGPKSIRATRDELQDLYKDLTGEELKIEIDFNNIEAATEALRIFADTAEVSLLDAKEAFNIMNAEIDASASLQQRLGEAFADAARMIADSGELMVEVFEKVYDKTYTMAQGLFVIYLSLYKTVIDTVRNTILAYAAEVAAAQFKKYGTLPGGLIMGAAAAATALSLVSALLSKVPGALESEPPKKMHRGGIVPGIGNSDTVPAMLTPGELVIPADMTRRLISRQGFNQGGVVGGGGGGTIVINFNDQSMIPKSPAEVDRMIRDKLVPSLRRLKRKGAGV